MPTICQCFHATPKQALIRRIWACSYIHCSYICATHLSHPPFDTQLSLTNRHPTDWQLNTIRLSRAISLSTRWRHAYGAHGPYQTRALISPSSQQGVVDGPDGDTSRLSPSRCPKRQHPVCRRRDQIAPRTERRRTRCAASVAVFFFGRNLR